MNKDLEEFSYEKFLQEMEREEDFFFKALESELKGDHSPFNEDFRD